MSNFFAALDDSDNEGRNPGPAVTKKKAPKKEIVEPSKVAEKRPNKNDRNTRGGRGGRPPARDGKRTFDRRSGTGRGKEIKKGGGGGHNWGSDQNDAKKAEGPVTEGKEEANTPEDATAEKTEVAAEEPEPEPEDNTVSYDDYLASKAKPDTAAFKSLEIREVENEFAGKAAAKKNEDTTFLQMGGGKQLKKKGTGKKEKETLVLDFKIKSATGGDDKGDRGDRGGRRDGGRVDFDDNNNNNNLPITITIMSMSMRPRVRSSLQQPSWRHSIFFFIALKTLIIYASCRIPQIPLVEARTLAAAPVVTSRSALPNAPLHNMHEASFDDSLPKSPSPPSRWGCKTGLPRIPSFVKQRLSASSLPSPQPQNLQKNVDIEWSMSTRHVITQIRGGSDSDSEEEDDESDEYDDDEEEVESSDDEYDSEEEYETESDDENEHDSDEEEEEVVTKTSSSLKSSLLSKSQDAEKEIDYDDLLTPPAMQQFAVSIGVMLLSNRIDILDPKAVRIARFAFVAYIVSVQVFLLYVQLRAKKINDRTPIKISNPLASLAQNSGIGGGGGGNFMVKALADQVLSTQTTILEYDLKQVKKMNGGLLFPMVFLYFLHFKMKQVQPLLMQTATGFLNLAYSPLFQVYVLGRNLERPFKPPANPMMEALQQQQQQGQYENGEGEEVVDAVPEEIGEEENDDEEGGEGSEAEEEEVSDEEEESEDDDDEYDSDEE